CPNIACLPSKNIIHSARVRSLALRGATFGLDVGTISTKMGAVQQRKRSMVEDLIEVHADRYRSAGVDFIKGHARFVAPKRVRVERDGSDTREISGERVFLNLGTRAAYPAIPGLREA